MPFFSEEIYSTLKTKDISESVHLCDWPKVNEKDIGLELEKKMDKVREIVALALAERARAGIKVRQPLLKLKVRNDKLKIEKELLDLVKEELNVKEIVFDSKIKEEVELDTKITPELKEEGDVREIIRQIQELRKKARFTPKDKIVIYYQGEKDLKVVLEKNKKIILSETKANYIEKGLPEKEVLAYEKTIKINKKELSLAIKKVKK